MNISAKDKKLLVYLLAIALIAGPYFFVAKPLLDKQSTISSEVEQLRQQVSHYNEIYTNQAEYEGKIAEAQVKYNETVNKFFGGLNQDNTIMMVKDLENSTGVWISRISFTDEEVVYGTEAAEDENVETDGETEVIEIESLKGLRQDLNLDYAAQYDNFKKFIEYIENYDERLFISSITANYSVDSGLVGGSVVLSQYAVSGTGKEYNAPDLTSVRLGNETIFKQGVALLNREDEAEIESTESSDETEATEDNGNSEESSEQNSEQSAESNSQAAEETTPPVMGEDNGSGRRVLR